MLLTGKSLALPSVRLPRGAGVSNTGIELLSPEVLGLHRQKGSVYHELLKGRAAGRRVGLTT